MTKERMLMAHGHKGQTVRRTMYASIRPPPGAPPVERWPSCRCVDEGSPAGRRIDAGVDAPVREAPQTRLALEVEGRRPRAARRAHVLGVDLPLRDVAQLFLITRTPMKAGDWPTVPMLHAARHDLPDLLARFDLFRLVQCRGALEYSSKACSISGSSGFSPCLPPEAYHLAIRHTHVALDRSTGRHGMGRGRSSRCRRSPTGGSAAPVGRACRCQVALHLLDVRLDADLLPLLRDHLGDLGVRNELPADRDHLEPQPLPLPSRRRKPFGVLLVQANLVQQLVGLLQVERRPLCATPAPGCRSSRRPGAAEPGVPRPRQKVSFSWSRSMPSDSAWRKSLLRIHFAISGSSVVARCRSGSSRRRR